MIDKNIELTNDLLQYVTDLSVSFYCTEINEDDDGNMFETPSYNDVFQFKARYNKGFLTHKFIYDEYVKNEEVQKTLSGLNIDSLKFWLLLLFVYDYTAGFCIDGLTYKMPEQEIKEFTDAINENIKELTYSKISFNKPIKITLKIGSKNIVIDNPETIGYLTCLCMSDPNGIDKATIFRTVRGEKNRIIPTSLHIWYVINMLINFMGFIPKADLKSKKDKTISYNRKLLIARLIVLMKFPVGDNFDDDHLKGILNTYKNHKAHNLNDRYLC